MNESPRALTTNNRRVSINLRPLLPGLIQQIVLVTESSVETKYANFMREHKQADIPKLGKHLCRHVDEKCKENETMFWRTLQLDSHNPENVQIARSNSSMSQNS